MSPLIMIKQQPGWSRKQGSGGNKAAERKRKRNNWSIRGEIKRREELRFLWVVNLLAVA